MKQTKTEKIVVALFKVPFQLLFIAILLASYAFLLFVVYNLNVSIIGWAYHSTIPHLGSFIGCIAGIYAFGLIGLPISVLIFFVVNFPAELVFKSALFNNESERPAAVNVEKSSYSQEFEDDWNEIFNDDDDEDEDEDDDEF